MRQKLSRRRFIGISAAASGMALLPIGSRARAEAQLFTWSGTVLGASATLQIHHHDRVTAERVIERSVREAERLERMFSLYRHDSALVALNRQGFLIAPEPDFIDLLAECRHVNAMTDGAFDPTVQPLWALYAEHFSHPGASAAGPEASSVQAALQCVGMRHVLVSRDRIAFARRGMALTLNGIAQGYLTDRVVAILRSEGIDHSLVDMGESRALGTRPDGRPWTVGILDPDGSSAAGDSFALIDQAVATSGAYGFQFDGRGRFNHLFDPRTGVCATQYQSVTVVMPTATAADAFATAFSLMPIEHIENALKSVQVGTVHVTGCDGRRTTFSTDA